MLIQKTALIGDSHAKVVFRYLAKLLPRRGFPIVYRRAENGWSLKKHIREGTLDHLKRSRPDLILVSLGGNNQSLNSEKYAQTVNQLLNLAKSMGSRIVWVGPTASNPNVAPNTERRHRWTTNFLQQYLPARKAFFFDTREWTGSGWGKDGVHYPSAKYKAWAKIVSSRLRQIRKQLKPPKAPLAKIRRMAWIGGGASALLLLVAASFKLARRGSKSKDKVIPLFPPKQMNEKRRIEIAEKAFHRQFSMPFQTWVQFLFQADAAEMHNQRMGREGPFKPLPAQILKIPISKVSRWAKSQGLGLFEDGTGITLDVDPILASSRGED